MSDERDAGDEPPDEEPHRGDGGSDADGPDPSEREGRARADESGASESGANESADADESDDFESTRDSEDAEPEQSAISDESEDGTETEDESDSETEDEGESEDGTDSADESESEEATDTDSDTEDDNSTNDTDSDDSDYTDSDTKDDNSTNDTDSDDSDHTDSDTKDDNSTNDTDSDTENDNTNDSNTENNDDESASEDESEDNSESEKPDSLDITDEELASAAVTVGEYDWEEFKEEYFYEDGSPPTNWRGKAFPFEPEEYLGYDPAETGDRVDEAAETAVGLSAYFEDFLDPEKTPVALGEYLWEHFRYEYYYEEDDDEMVLPRDEEGEVVSFDRSEWVGHDDFPASVFEAGTAVTDLSASFEEWLDPATTPVTKGEYYWEHFKYEYYYTDTDVTAPDRPRDDEGNIDRFEKEDWLGFPEENIEERLAEGAHDARKLLEIEDERTLDVPEELDEDAFFSTVEGHTTVVNRYDLEKEVSLPKKQHFRERDRYWVNKPYSFVVIFHSAKENETKYYLIEPYCTPIEEDLKEFLTGKLRSSIKYSSDDVVVEAEDEQRAEVIEREAMQLLARYDLYAENDGERAEQLEELLERYDETRDAVTAYVERLREETDAAFEPIREAIESRRERAKTDEVAEDGEANGDEAGDERGGDEPAEIEGDEDGSDSVSSESDADTDEVAADGGEQSPDDCESRQGAERTDGGAVEDEDELETPTPEGPDSPDSLEAPEKPESRDGESANLPANPDAGESDEDNLPATTDEDAEPRIRLDEYLDLDFEAKGSLREQARAAFEAKIEALEPDESGGLNGIMVRPEPVLIEEDNEDLSEYQTEKLLYFLKRDFTGYERIDGIKHDINVEDISVDGYNSPVFVYHTDHEQIISNVYHGEDELDDFVVKMAQRSGKGISKRQPQVDATLPDGSRAQLTLGREVSDHGTNYTIRQFKDVPFTPIDLVNWNTFSLEEMAFMWLAIENHKSLIFAGGTASGKTTSLNAVSLFIPSNSKIVSIEDTREVELPQRNWIASVTRPSFSDDDKGDVDEFDLLEAALRQRPDYIVMGEIRGEEGRTLFQVMSTGHTTYTTFHADTVGEVLKRFTTEPINVSKTLFTALDLVSIQTETRIQGSKVRRNKSLTEINEYNAENDEINVQDIFQWRADDDEFMRLSGSNTMDDIMFDRGWDRDQLEKEILKRRVILAYLIKNGLNKYAEVAATVQAFINDPDTILTLVANEKLEESLQDLREMESVQINVDPKKEEMVPRPDPGEETYELAKGILAEAEDRLLDDYRGADADVDGLAVALAETAEPTDAPSEVSPDAGVGPEASAESEASPDPDAPFGGDILGPESVGNVDVGNEDDRDENVGDENVSNENALDERFQDTESVGPEDSVRNPNDAGELGNFPEIYDEDEEDETSEEDENDSFGDFEAAFEEDSDERDHDPEEDQR